MARIVIKIGSNILTEASGGLNHKRIAAIAGDISIACDGGHEIRLKPRVLVISSFLHQQSNCPLQIIQQATHSFSVITFN